MDIPGKKMYLCMVAQEKDLIDLKKEFFQDCLKRQLKFLVLQIVLLVFRKARRLPLELCFLKN